jgi:hypothetical protein
MRKTTPRDLDARPRQKVQHERFVLRLATDCGRDADSIAPGGVGACQPRHGSRRIRGSLSPIAPATANRFNRNAALGWIDIHSMGGVR